MVKRKSTISVYHVKQKYFNSSSSLVRCLFIKIWPMKVLAGFGDSQVIVKVTGWDTSSGPMGCRVLQLNWASVSSFLAEYSSTEEVVDRPVTGSTCTEVWIEIPEQETNNLFEHSDKEKLWENHLIPTAQFSTTQLVYLFHQPPETYCSSAMWYLQLDLHLLQHILPAVEGKKKNQRMKLLSHQITYLE